MRTQRKGRLYWAVPAACAGALICLFSWTFLARAGTDPKIGPDALWQPGMGFLQQVHEACDKTGPGFGQCFVEQMQKFGAPAAAIAFTRRTDNQGILRDFRSVGPVDIAYAVYLFRANENQVCFLVNGEPPMIDVDNIHYFPQASLEKNPAFLKIKSRYPSAAIFPGDRGGSKYPRVIHLGGGGLRFLVNYHLNNLCHACARIGFAEVAFDFDSGGKFLKTKVVKVSAAAMSAPAAKSGGQK
jgi:hypothetical protein